LACALQNAPKQHNAEMVLIRVDPMLNNMRGDPRFQELVQKMNSLSPFNGMVIG